MRAVTDERLPLTNEVRRHLELCLDCRACETACPSGVQYGRLIEPFRVAMEAAGAEQKSKTNDWFHRWILYGLFPYPARMRAMLAPARIAQRLGLMRLASATGTLRLLPDRLRQLVTMLPAPREARGAATRVSARHRQAAGAGRFVSWLRGRRDVSPHALGYRAGVAA